MKRNLKMRVVCLVLALLLAAPLSGGASAAVSDNTLDTAVSHSLSYLYSQTQEPGLGSTRGEWAILALARGGYLVPEGYYDAYYDALVSLVTRVKGVLSRKEYTEYSRTLVALSAIGKDGRSVGGYDLVSPLGNYSKTIWQGNNGPIWALIALDTAAYTIPEIADADKQATRQRYIDRILDKQLNAGGWVYSDTAAGTASPDPDMTAMALQALAKYTDQPAVAAAVDRAVAWLSSAQNSNGGFSTVLTNESSETCESAAQVIVALCELGIDPEDSRFVKNGKSVLSNLLGYQQSGGGFRHVASGEVDQMASEQGTYALVAVQRFRNGQNSLYDMTDVLKLTDAPILQDPAGNAADIAMAANGSLTFTLPGGITVTGKSGQFTVSCSQACTAVSENVLSGALNKKTVSGSSHTLTAAANEKLYIGLKGDVNGDGALSARDTTLILRTLTYNGTISNSSLSELQRLFADADGDGKMSARDATLLLRTMAYAGTEANSSIGW